MMVKIIIVLLSVVTVINSSTSTKYNKTTKSDQLLINLNNFLKMLIPSIHHNMQDILIVLLFQYRPLNINPSHFSASGYNIIESLSSKHLAPQKLIITSPQEVVPVLQTFAKSQLRRCIRFRNHINPSFIFVFSPPGSVLKSLILHDEFTVSKDLLVIVTRQRFRDVKFDPGIPNFLPRYAIHIGHSEPFFISALHPFKSNGGVNKWVHYSGNGLQKGVECTLPKRSAKPPQFLRAPVFLYNFRDDKFRGKNGVMLSLCKQRRRASPWNTYIDTIIACEISQRLNLTGVATSSYTYASIGFDSISLPFNRAGLFSSGNYLKIGFLVPIHSQTLDIEGIIGPIGLDVLLWTVSCASLVTLFVFVSIHCISPQLKRRHLTLYESFQLVWRPILEQCVERLPLNNDFFRIVLIPWFLYCVILTEMYRGELVGYLIRPSVGHVPETFEELANSKRPVFVHGIKSVPTKEGYSCPPQSNAYIALSKTAKYSSNQGYSKLMSQLENCNARSVSATLNAVLKRLTTKWDVLIDEVLRLEELQSAIGTMTVNRYMQLKISKESVINPIYIGIADDLYRPEVVRLFAYLRDQGIFPAFFAGMDNQRFFQFWRYFKRKPFNGTGSLEVESFNNMDYLGGSRSNKGPVILTLSHLTTLLLIHVTLMVGSVLLFLGEVGLKICNKRDISVINYY